MTKQGKGNKKYGRNKRAPTHAAQSARSAANRSRRVAQTSARKPKALTVPHGTARAKRRAQWANARVRVQENGREFWKPTFAEFTAGAVARPMKIAA